MGLQKTTIGDFPVYHGDIAGRPGVIVIQVLLWERPMHLTAHRCSLAGHWRGEPSAVYNVDITLVRALNEPCYCAVTN
jgi:hypothetical protein